MAQRDILIRQYLAEAPPLFFGFRVYGMVTLSSRTCIALISTVAPRTHISPVFTRSEGLHSEQRDGDWTRRPDGSRYRPIERFHADLHISVAGIFWRVRAVEADTGPFDLILGIDWLQEHHSHVHVYGVSFTLQAPGGRMVLQFRGRPAILVVTPLS